jgi:hypothetical protein
MRFTCVFGKFAREDLSERLWEGGGGVDGRMVVGGKRTVKATLYQSMK